MTRRIVTSLVLTSIRLVSSSIGIGQEGGTRFVRGDYDQNGIVNMFDGVWIYRFIFLGGQRADCEAAADASGNGEIDIADFLALVNWLYLGGRALPSPTPHLSVYDVGDCGLDPSGFGMSCDSFAPCN
jgi:hypothetical protein